MTPTRCYNPTLGRMLAHDPLSLAAPGWTGYRFGWNRPNSVTDPTGMAEDVVIRMDNPHTDGYGELSATSAGIGKMVRVRGGDGPGPGDPPKVDPWGAIVGKVKSFWKSLGFSDEDAPTVQETVDYVEELGDNLQPAVDVLTAPIPGGSLLNPGASGGQKALDVGLSIFPGVGFVDDAGRLVVKTSSQILSWGKNSVGHLIKHRDVLGFGNVSAQQAQKMLPQLRGAANQLYNNLNHSSTRIGAWPGQSDNVLMHITNNGKMLVTKTNGEFITVINKTSNAHYVKAAPFK